MWFAVIIDYSIDDIPPLPYAKLRLFIEVVQRIDSLLHRFGHWLQVNCSAQHSSHYEDNTQFRAEGDCSDPQETEGVVIDIISSQNF